MKTDTARNAGAMHLKVLLPTEVLVNKDVVKVIAEAENGAFCLEPRHIDFVAALLPGILTYSPAKDSDRYVAVDGGTLVKCGDEVLVSAQNGVLGTDLRRLRALVEESFLTLDEHERKTRTALARLEAGTLRGFREMQERTRG